MRITFDPVKRQTALNERGLDFTDAGLVFAGPTITVQDIRKDRRISRRPDGDDCLDTARRSATHHIDEKVQ